METETCGCGLRANKVFLDNGGQVYSCTCCMRAIYDSLSDGGKKPVFMDDLLEPKGFREVKPIADPNWKGIPKAKRYGDAV